MNHVRIVRHFVSLVLAEVSVVEVDAFVGAEVGQDLAGIVFHRLVLGQDFGALVRTPRFRYAGRTAVVLRALLGGLGERDALVVRRRRRRSGRKRAHRIVVRSPDEVLGFVERLVGDLRAGPLEHRIAVGPVIVAAGPEVVGDRTNRRAARRRDVNRRLHRHRRGGLGRPGNVFRASGLLGSAVGGVRGRLGGRRRRRRRVGDVELRSLVGTADQDQHQKYSLENKTDR